MSAAELGAALRKALADLPITLGHDPIRLLGASCGDQRVDGPINPRTVAQEGR